MRRIILNILHPQQNIYQELHSLRILLHENKIGLSSCEAKVVDWLLLSLWRKKREVMHTHEGNIIHHQH